MNRDRQFLLLLVAIFTVLTALLVAPFIQYVLAAIVLAYLLAPVHRRLGQRIGNRIAAVALMVASLLAIVLPLLVLLRSVLREARRVAGNLQEFTARTRLPPGLIGDGVTLRELLGLSGAEGSAIVGEVLGILGGVTDVVVGLVIMLFVLYYLLTAGPSLIHWTRRAAPLRADTLDELFERLDQLMYAVVVVNVAIAVVQGVLTGLGLWVVGFSNIIFWTVVTVALSLFPFVGAPFIWGPAALYLILMGAPVRGVALAIWGTAVVGLSDDYLRPVLGGRQANLNPGLFVVGIFGGVAAFGVMGVFFGPVVLGILKALVELFVRDAPTTKQ